LASGGDDHSVRVWDVATGACEAVLAGHTGTLWALAVLADGRLASGSWDGRVRLWDVPSRTCVAELGHGAGVDSLAALPCGGLASGGADGRIALWSAAGVRTATLGGRAGFWHVLSLAVLLDGRLAAGYGLGGPNVVRVWDVPRRAVDAVIRGHTSDVSALAALADGRLLSGSFDHTLKMWDERALSVRGGADTDTCAATLEGHTSYVSALAVLPDRRVASGSLDGTVRVWQ
jgi:WD40 repeat protein